jgi:hypothetical protein
MRKRSLGFLAATLAASLMAVSSAHATVFIYNAILDGPSEAPPNPSPGVGTAQAIYDDVAHTLTVSASFSGLLGTTTAAHIHAVVPNTPTTAGVATMTPSFTNFPLGVTSGIMPPTIFNLTAAASWNGSFIAANGGTTAGAEAALIGAMNNLPPHPTVPSRAYFNIHTTNTPGGEIRGFLELVPEPTTIGMAGAMILGLVAASRRRK